MTTSLIKNLNEYSNMKIKMSEEKVFSKDEREVLLTTECNKKLSFTIYSGNKFKKLIMK